MTNTIKEQKQRVPVSPLARSLGRFVLRLTGWEAVGPVPAIPKYVLCVAPHTSNWDFLYMLAGALALGIRASWMAKKELFRPPLGWVLRAIGGIPVDRSRRGNLVDQAVEAYNEADELIIAVLPEGTRSHTDYWKSGFYHIALLADLPVVCGFADYATKRVGAGPTLHMSGDVEADLDKLRTFYGPLKGKFPESQGPVRFR